MRTHGADAGNAVQAAANWHARFDAPDMDWNAFAAWLDADPAHREAYDAIALLDAHIIEHGGAILQALPANDSGDDEAPAPTPRRWWAGGGIAIAAVLVAVIAPQMSLFTAETMVAYYTGPAESRRIALKDGSHILLDRNSRMMLADGSAPRIELQTGTAFFDIRHDPSRALTIKAGDYEVRDIGTQFDLALSPGRLAVAVSEGQVTVAPKAGSGTQLSAGERMDIATTSGDATVRPVSADAVGAWRTGQLVYQDTPLSLVATDLSRYGGRPVSVDPAVSDMRVSGVLSIGDGSTLIQQVEALLPVKAVVAHGAVRLRGSRAR